MNKQESIKELNMVMRDYGLTNKEMANMLGVSNSIVWWWLHDKCIPSDENYKKILDVLEKRPWETMGKGEWKTARRKVFMAVSTDKYSLPLAVADSTRELAEMTGERQDTISSHISHCKRQKIKSPRFIVVEVDEE